MLYLVYPGRFEPPHPGHSRLIKNLCNEHHDISFQVVVGITESVDPFSFEEKINIFNDHLFLEKYICNGKLSYSRVENPYKISSYDMITPEDIVLFIVSSKDLNRFDFKNRKDGEKKYLQPWTGSPLPCEFHAYISFRDTHEYYLYNDVPANSATEFRNTYKKIHEDHIEAQYKLVENIYINNKPHDLVALFNRRLRRGITAEDDEKQEIKDMEELLA